MRKTKTNVAKLVVDNERAAEQGSTEVAGRKRRVSTLPPNLPPRGLHREQAAEYCGIGATLFDDWVKRRLLPEPWKIDGRRVWDRHKIDKALDALDREADADDPYARMAP